MLRLFILIFIQVFILNTVAGEEFRLEGHVSDAETGESLWNANVYVYEIGRGMPAGPDGRFSFPVEAGTYTVRITYTGYSREEKIVEVTEDTYLEIVLQPVGFDVEGVEIEADRRERQVESTEMGRVDLDMESVERLPVVFGEVDILKTLQLMPGVQSTSEGSSALHVRGGGPDQNLILLEGAPIYNASHLLGFFSVFHPDAIDDFSMMKGDMPARYGGRLSSIIDINMRDGSEDEFNFRGGIGLISSRIMGEGPVGDNGGFMVAGRRTYIDVLAQPVLPEELKGNRYFFHDVKGKVHYRLSSSNTLSFSGYLGRDIFRLTLGDESFMLPEISTDWGNKAMSLRWDHRFNNDFFANFTLYYTEYDFSNVFTFPAFDLSLSNISGIRDIGLTNRYDYYLGDDHHLRFGFEAINHLAEPGFARFSAGEDEQEIDVLNRKANTFSLYAEDEWTITDALRINFGLRYSFFLQTGPYEILDRDESGFIRDTTEFKNLEPAAIYDGWEPRISGRYKLNELTSVKASYSRNYQFMHLASVTGGTLPTDVWIPSSKLVKPQMSDQVSTGIFREIEAWNLDLSTEVYYRWLENQTDFRPGAQLIANPFLDEEFLQGSGTAYGVEFLVKKERGDISGWIGYTWAHTDRKIEGINRGNPYSPRFDITHDLSFVANYKLSEEWDVSLVFEYATGRPFTPEIGRFAGDFGFGQGFMQQPFNLYPIYHDELNDFRMEDYHRADISANYRPGAGEDRPFQSYWNFSIYNVYNRANPYFYIFSEDFETGEHKVEKVYIFPILPSITYNFRF